MKKGTLNDPQNVSRDVTTVGHHGNGDYELTLKDSSNLGHVLSLIRQSYDRNFKTLKESVNVSDEISAVKNIGIKNTG